MAMTSRERMLTAPANGRPGLHMLTAFPSITFLPRARP
jgi:hypothetical protein